MRDGYSFKWENNGCSIYMSNIFYGHVALKSGLSLFLDSSVTPWTHMVFGLPRGDKSTRVTQGLKKVLARVLKPGYHK